MSLTLSSFASRAKASMCGRQRNSSPTASVLDPMRVFAVCQAAFHAAHFSSVAISFGKLSSASAI
jgi:hypothetical protein